MLAGDSRRPDVMDARVMLAVVGASHDAVAGAAVGVWVVYRAGVVADGEGPFSSQSA